MDQNCNTTISPEEIAIANTQANPHTSTGISTNRNWVKQPTGASVHYATVSPHLLIEEAYIGNGGFLGLGEGYDSNGEKVRSYILNKASENFYVNRVEGGVYNNIFKPFLHELIEPIYAAGVHYDTNSQPFLDFVEKANGNGSSYNSIKIAAGVSAVAHQVSYVIIDKSPKSDKVRMSYKRVNDVYQDCEDQGFGLDEDGELNWIGFLVDVKEDGTLVRHKHIVGAIIVQEKKGNASSSETWQDVEEHPTGIDMLNVYPLFYRDTQGGEFVPLNPDMLSIVFLLANLYNLDTKVDYVIVQQAHGTLVISTGGEVAGIPDGQSSAIILDMSPDGKASTAEFLSIDASILTALLDASEDKLSKVKNLMGDKGVDLKQTQSAESGIAKAFEFSGQNAELLHGVAMFERLDKWVIEIFKAFTFDTSQFDVEITYASDFYPTTAMTMDDIDVAWNILSQTNQTPMKKALLYQLGTIITNKRPQPVVQEVMEEIDNLTVNDPLTGQPALD